MKEISGIIIAKCAVYGMAAIVWCFAPDLGKVVPIVCAMWGIVLLNLIKGIVRFCKLSERTKVLAGTGMFLTELAVTASLPTAVVMSGFVTLSDILGGMLFLFMTVGCILEAVSLLWLIDKNMRRGQTVLKKQFRVDLKIKSVAPCRAAMGAGEKPRLFVGRRHLLRLCLRLFSRAGAFIAPCGGKACAEGSCLFGVGADGLPFLHGGVLF